MTEQGKVLAKTNQEETQKEKGATAVEYAVMLALIIVVVLSAVTFIGRKASTNFSRVGSAMPS
jgi:pilus assembly protein Flp/PilA